MKVFVRGKGEVSLGQREFVAQGGQASVYQRSGTAYKVYTNPADAIPETKFAQLSAIQDTDVVKPEHMLLDGSSNPIGYTMRFLSDTHALCQLFTKAFRDRNSVDAAKMQHLVEELQRHVANVHRAGVLIVDLNELNILVSKDFKSVILIDVDSYQTRDFPATVLMPSVRDWSVKGGKFSELSDWFSFAVLMCQLYVGLHPYRGTHAASNSIAPAERLEHRMRQNISIFDKSVTVPKACAPFSSIPNLQREWLEAVLQHGKRLPPPPPGAAAYMVPVAAPVPTFGGQLVVGDLGTYVGEVLAYAEGVGRTLVLTRDAVFVDGRMCAALKIQGAVLLGFTPKLGKPVALSLSGGVVSVYEFDERRATHVNIAADAIAKSGDRFYVKVGTRIQEVEFIETANGVTFAASHQVADVVEHASTLFDGCVVQSMLGSVFVSLFPRSKAGFQVRIPELDRYRIVEARFEGGVLMVLASKGGKYDRLVFRFDQYLATYDLRKVENVSPAGVNFAVTGNGICVSVTEDENIEAFPAAKGAGGMRIVDDPAIGNDMRLLRIGARVGFARGNKLHSMQLR